MGLINSTEQSYYQGNDFGGYQFITLKDIVNNFMISYVGEDKIIPKIKRNNVTFFAQRALQELSYDTFRSEKSQEIDIPPSLTMMLPQDYVNYVKVSWVDDSGIEHTIYPAIKTSNPDAILQDSDSNYIFDGSGNLVKANESETWKKYKDANTNKDVVNDFYLEDNRSFQVLNGQRYGADPQYMNSNGAFYIDPLTSKIHFSASLTDKTVTLKYISDSLGTDSEMKVHKLAEEAMYKCIAYYIMSTRSNTPEFLVMRFKKEKFAAVRQAKLRLSNIKLEELTQTMRGKSKHIKH
tara:strand:+ start:2822 stop:3703 length:882 start_codon:yes stop_codon:yes gene_type:complete